MARPKNPNAKTRKPREPKNTDVATLLQQATSALTAVQAGLLNISSLDEASVSIIQLNNLRRQAKEMENFAQFIHARFESEAELKRQLAEAIAPRNLTKKPAIAAE